MSTERSPDHPVTIFTAASFITMDPTMPRADAVAVAGGRVVGSLVELTATFSQPPHPRRNWRVRWSLRRPSDPPVRSL